MSPLDQRLAVVIGGMRFGRFTADTYTANGALTLDPEHKPNAGNNGIGAYFRSAAQRGLIEWTGDVIRSGAPHRKGGAIRVWRPTEAGRRWADEVLAAD